jgi:hypothetical protein
LNHHPFLGWLSSKVKEKDGSLDVFFNQLNSTFHPSINVLLGHGKGSRVIFLWEIGWEKQIFFGGLKLKLRYQISF